MAIAERPTLFPEEKEALLEQLRAKYANESAGVGNTKSSDRGNGDESEPERSWHSLGIELEEVPETPAVDAIGRDALARMFVLLERHRPAWQRDALCIEYADTVTWFPARGESVEPAKDVCSRCLVAEECHAYAVEIDAPVGIWSGTSARNLRREAVIG